MSHQKEIFPAAATARREISRTAYILFGVGVLLMACGAAGGSIAFATSATPNMLLIALAIGVSCAGIGGLIAGLVTLARLRQSIQVEVSPYRLVWREGNKLATLEYEEVVRVELVKGQTQVRGVTFYYPVIRFIENDGEMMEFEVTFEDRGHIHTSRFDARAITREVLPYLPQHVVVAPTVQEFVRTGEVDIDLLPAR